MYTFTSPRSNLNTSFSTPSNEDKTSYIQSHMSFARASDTEFDEPYLSRDPPDIRRNEEPTPVPIEPPRYHFTTRQGTDYFSTSVSSATTYDQNEDDSALPPTKSINDIIGKPMFSESGIQRENIHMQPAPILAPTDLVERPRDDNWVTVFGFPPSSTTYVLHAFQEYGEVVKHETRPGANWMHLQYLTRLQSQKALSRNGKMVGNTMIGVLPRSSETGGATQSTISAIPHKPSLQERSSQYAPVNPHLAVEPTVFQLPKEKSWYGKFVEYTFGW